MPLPSCWEQLEVPHRGDTDLALGRCPQVSLVTWAGDRSRWHREDAQGHLQVPEPRAPCPESLGNARGIQGMPLTGSVLFPVIPLLYLLFLHLPPPLLGRDRLPRFHGNTPPLPSFLQRGFHPFLSKTAIFSHGFPFSPSPHSASSSRFPRQAAPTRHP